MSAAPHAVMVGIDELPGTEAALRWAIDEARSRNAPLRLVCAYRWALTYDPLSTFADTRGFDEMQTRRAADRLVATAIDRVAAVADGVEVSGEAIDGNAVPVLVEQSEHAALLVLGSRHLTAIGATVLGSVGAGVAARAACPVVVVRGPAGDPAEGATVVAAVDGTEESQTVLGYGFDHAARHRVPLHAVLCWRPDLLASMLWRKEPPPPARAEAWLSEALAGWREKYPDVVVHSAVVRDHPVAGLVAASAAQHLLVVGSRGRHALAGSLLGSVSLGVLHHATCPVAVLPTHAA